MIIVKLTGNTYGIKETLKGLGFKWNKDHWRKSFGDHDEAKANEIANRWYSEGVYGEITRK